MRSRTEVVSGYDSCVLVLCYGIISCEEYSPALVKIRCYVPKR
jgi:hypothetical protein